MYFLMNKDNIVLSFQVDKTAVFSDDVTFSVIEKQGQMPYGFHDITSWIESRKASKHNGHLKAVMKQLRCEDNEGFIRLTHATGINDTFWIKPDRESISWNNVSLFQNQFTEAVSKLAFEGMGLYGDIFSSTSPELSCEGSFRKCFIKEKEFGEFGNDIFLYKRGHELGAGMEPYCEALASEVAKVISPTQSVKYNVCRLHDKLASRCNIFTNEKQGYASFSKMYHSKMYSLQSVFDFFQKNGSEQEFREMLVVDSLCFNQDRHSGNYGILFDNDTLKILGMAPVFDLNISMFPYVELEEFEHIGDKLFEYAPKLGDDFTRIGQMAINDVLRDRVKDMKDFSFRFRGDESFSEKRIRCLENIIHKQAAALLSHEKLQTKDVFFSQKAVLEKGNFENNF